MEFLNKFIVLIVTGVCLCVGYIIKHLIPNETANRFIPLVVAVLGIFVNVWLNGFTITPEILLGGMVSGLASTGMHQLFKQFINKNDIKTK